MNTTLLQNALEMSGLSDELGLGNYSVFAPTKDSGDPIPVHVLRGRFAPADFAEILWCASLSDKEIDAMAELDARTVAGSYDGLVDAIRA